MRSVSFGSGTKSAGRTGICWIDCHQEEACVYAFERRSSRERIAEVYNFSDQMQEYVMEVKEVKQLRLLMSSNLECYGGNETEHGVAAEPRDGKFVLVLPPFSARYYLVK